MQAEDFIKRIRQMMRDYPELNRLIEGVEHSSDDIKKAAAEVIIDFNNTPPPIGIYRLSNFPDINLLIDGTIARLLISVTFLKIRNQLTYRDGETQVSENKGQVFAQLGQTLWADYNRRKSDLKYSLNMARGFGGVTPVNLGASVTVEQLLL